METELNALLDKLELACVCRLELTPLVFLGLLDYNYMLNNGDSINLLCSSKTF